MVGLLSGHQTLNSHACRTGSNPSFNTHLTPDVSSHTPSVVNDFNKKVEQMEEWIKMSNLEGMPVSAVSVCVQVHQS